MRQQVDSTDADREANEFAMRLLVPDMLLAKEDLSIDMTSDEPIQRLAKRYGVSVPVMLIRIKQFRKENR